MYKPFFIERDLSTIPKRGISIQVHISDIHFGVISPKVEFDILKVQFLDRIKDLDIDCISVDGDLFDKLSMSNTDTVLYANLFVRELYNICKANYNRGIHTVLILLMGTKNHDADQLKLFYSYRNDPEVDVRIVETIQFEYINGCKVLCIPELYNIDESVYSYYLHQCNLYDMVFLHGTIEGAVYNDGNTKEYRIFDNTDFSNCLGPVIAGHIHTGGRYLGYCYYNGSPVRWAFGEEEDKGYQIVLYDMDTHRYFIYKDIITSFRYDTIFIDDILANDPKDVIAHVESLKSKGIDHIRLECTDSEKLTANLNVLKEYFRNDKSIKFKVDKINKLSEKAFTQQTKQLYETYSYLFNNSMSPYEKFVKYVNDSQDKILVTVDQLMSILKEDI